MSGEGTFLGKRLRVAGLFAGIGGIELGLERAGHNTKFLCEVDPAAKAVLKLHFPKSTHRSDIRKLTTIPKVELLTAGFPCQDLSPAGRTIGITGEKSGLVAHVFRLLRQFAVDWVLLENVPFMLQLDGGRAMSWLTRQFEVLNYRWAYRTVDTRSFGLPHRRRRVLFLASEKYNPEIVLFADDASRDMEQQTDASAYGFYWTEGNTGVGWAHDSVPTLKGGSGIGIPSPPAVWIPATGEIGMPHILDGERLQGFPENWTKAAVGTAALTSGARWRLLGNAVSVPVAEWLGQRLLSPGTIDEAKKLTMKRGDKWPAAACGQQGKRWKVNISEFPESNRPESLSNFLSRPLNPLSYRAASGFLNRFEQSSLKKHPVFLDALRTFVAKTHELEAPSSSSPIASSRMRSVRQSATDVEARLLKALRVLRFKFEQNTYAVNGLRTKPDVVFRRKKIAVYIDGCFWHSCPHHGTNPQSNSQFWDRKLKENAARDHAQVKALQEHGWKVLRFWSHEDVSKIVQRIKSNLTV